MFKIVIEIVFAGIVFSIVYSLYSKKTTILKEDNKYDTFGPRFWAGAVDGTIFAPFSYFMKSIISVDANVQVIFVWFVINSLAILIYSVSMHAIWGQTVGKMLCKVKVVRYSGEKTINFYLSLLRDSVPITLSIVTIFYYIFQTTVGNPVITNRIIALKGQGQPNFDFITWVWLLWSTCEIITMLTNKKRRALHDYIAGTVVVRM